MAAAQIEYGEGMVVTSTSSASPNFIPMTRWISATDVLQVRGTLEMRGNSSLCSITAGYQTSNDQVSLDSPATFPAAQTLRADGFLYPSAFSDISTATTGKRFVRFGLMCAPGSGSAIHSCWAAIAVEILPQYPNLVSSAGRIVAAGAVTNYVACETANNNASGIIGSGCNFSKNFPSNPSSITVGNQSISGVNSTANTFNLQVGGVGIFHVVTGSGNAYFYETITAS